MAYIVFNKIINILSSIDNHIYEYQLRKDLGDTKEINPSIIGSIVELFDEGGRLDNEMDNCYIENGIEPLKRYCKALRDKITISADQYIFKYDNIDSILNSLKNSADTLPLAIRLRSIEIYMSMKRSTVANPANDEVIIFYLGVLISLLDEIQKKLKVCIPEDPSEKVEDIVENFLSLETVGQKLLLLAHTGIYDSLKKTIVKENSDPHAAKIAKLLSYIIDKPVKGIPGLLGYLDNPIKKNKNNPYTKANIEKTIRILADDLNLNTQGLNRLIEIKQQLYPNE